MNRTKVVRSTKRVRRPRAPHPPPARTRTAKNYRNRPGRSPGPVSCGNPVDEDDALPDVPTTAMGFHERGRGQAELPSVQGADEMAPQVRWKLSRSDPRTAHRCAR